MERHGDHVTILSEGKFITVPAGPYGDSVPGSEIIVRQEKKRGFFSRSFQAVAAACAFLVFSGVGAVYAAPAGEVVVDGASDAVIMYNRFGRVINLTFEEEDSETAALRARIVNTRLEDALEPVAEKVGSGNGAAAGTENGVVFRLKEKVSTEAGSAVQKKLEKEAGETNGKADDNGGDTKKEMNGEKDSGKINRNNGQDVWQNDKTDSPGAEGKGEKENENFGENYVFPEDSGNEQEKSVQNGNGKN